MSQIIATETLGEMAGRAVSIRVDEFAYKPHVFRDAKPQYGQLSFGRESIHTVTRAEMDYAPLDWVDSMRAKLAAKHGVPVEWVCFNQMSYADPAVFGEFCVRKAVTSPEVKP